MSQIYLDEKAIQSPIHVDFSSDEVLVDRHCLGATDVERLKHNLYTLARKNSRVRELVVGLCNQGFAIVSHSKGISRFIRFSNAEDMIPHMRGYEYAELSTHGRIVYSVDHPSSMTAKRMLVVFSAVADPTYATNIAKRNFFKNFGSISKFIPPDACVLRLSDVGVVVGSFYMNNNFDSKVESSVQETIALVAHSLSIDHENIVLYGVSKGGTGAFYHGVMGGYKVVAVDPVLSEDHHERVHGDCHFTVGTFPERRFDKFVQLLKSSETQDTCSIISSSHSPILEQVRELLGAVPAQHLIDVYDYQHQGIKDHPHVGGHSINLLTTLLNGHFYGLLRRGWRTFPHGG